MLNQIIHNATITVQLPCSLGAQAEITALRLAGIPVDDLGNATSGYLFLRTTGRGNHRTNTFRWFTAGSGQAFAHAAPPPASVTGGQASAV
jgi:hypothetical protein